MEAPASERTETAAPTQAAPTQAAGAKTQAASAAPGAHDNLADPPADWPKEGPFDDPTKPEKAYVEAAVRTVLSSKLGLAAEDDRVFAEAAPGGPASAADDKEAREMLRYLDEESALYAAGVAVDDTERELAAAEAARRKAGAPPSKRPKGLESKAWKGGFFDTKRPAAKKKPFDKMRLLPPAPDAPGRGGGAAGAAAAVGGAHRAPVGRGGRRARGRDGAAARARRGARARATSRSARAGTGAGARAARRARALRARPAGRPRGAGRRARARAGHSVVGLHREEKEEVDPELLRRARGDGGSARRRAAEAQRVRRRREGRGGDGRDEPEARGPAALRAAGPGEPAEPKRGRKFAVRVYDRFASASRRANQVLPLRRSAIGLCAARRRQVQRDSPRKTASEDVDDPQRCRSETRKPYARHKFKFQTGQPAAALHSDAARAMSQQSPILVPDSDDDVSVASAGAVEARRLQEQFDAEARRARGDDEATRRLVARLAAPAPVDDERSLRLARSLAAQPSEEPHPYAWRGGSRPRRKTN